jgi:hypothetical protein
MDLEQNTGAGGGGTGHFFLSHLHPLCSMAKCNMSKQCPSAHHHHRRHHRGRGYARQQEE